MSPINFNANIIKCFDSVFPEIKVVKLFFLTTKRTVWGGKKSHRYIPHQSMHQSFKSAINKAENLRNCGTSFLIEELPVLSIQNQFSAILISQINEDVPLRFYNIESIPILFNSVYWDMQRIVDSFNPKSETWKSVIPTKNSILLYSAFENSQTAKSTETFNLWHSNFLGSKLQFEITKYSAYSSENIFRIVDCFNETFEKNCIDKRRKVQSCKSQTAL